MGGTLLTLEDVLAGASSAGLDLSERTFRYYAVLGLLPRPVRRPSGSDDARVAWYPAAIMQRLLDIRSLQAQGYSLKQIKQHLAVRDEPAERPPTSKEPARASAAVGDILGIVRAVGGSAVAEVGWRFMVEALLHPDEIGLRRAALRYYEDLAACLLGAASAATAHSALSRMSPLELEPFFTPLRTWRDGERVRRVEQGRRALASTTLLRRVAAELERGLPASRVEALGGEIARLAQLRRRLDAVDGDERGCAAALVGMARGRLDDLIDLMERVRATASREGGRASASDLIETAARIEDDLLDVLRAVDSLERLRAREVISLPEP